MPRKQAHLNADAFLGAYACTASITRAAEAAKIDRALHYRWLKSPGYKAAFENASVQAGQILQDEAVRRAIEGTLEPVFYQGMKCGAIRRYSDTMLLSLLRAFMPQKYSAKAEITGAGGAPIETAMQVTFVKPSD